MRSGGCKTFCAYLSACFGNLKILWNAFTNCGVRHDQDISSKDICLDQVQYAQNLRPIAHPQLSTGQAADLCGPDLHQLYMSLLGAVAYLSHTRVDVAVFVCALQRHASKPSLEHVRKLNKLLSWVQKHPKKLSYRRLPSAESNLRIVSDVAFKKETEDGYSLRGVTYLRGVVHDSFDSKDAKVHVIDWVCKAQRHVCRSTFAAELLGAGDAVDQGILVCRMLYEIQYGALTATQARERRSSQ